MTHIIVIRDSEHKIKAAFTNELLAGWYQSNFAEPTDTSQIYEQADPLLDKFEAGLLFYKVAIRASDGYVILSEQSKEIDKSSNQGVVYLDGRHIFYGFYWAKSEQEALDRLEQYRYETLLSWANSSPLAPSEE